MNQIQKRMAPESLTIAHKAVLYNWHQVPQNYESLANVRTYIDPRCTWHEIFNFLGSQLEDEGPPSLQICTTES